MIEKTIPVASIGTGITLIYSVTPGRTATIKQLIFTNSANAARTVHIFDSSSATTGVNKISRVIIGANQTFVPNEIINKKVELGYITAYCNEGTEVTCEGWIVEE